MNKYLYLLLLSSLITGCNSDDSGKDGLELDGSEPDLSKVIDYLREQEAQQEEEPDPEPEPEPQPEPVDVVIEESMAGFCDIDGVIESNHTGFTGTGFANVENRVDSAITYQINAQADGDYDVEITYAADSDRAGMLSSNGTDTELSFVSSTAWDAWTIQTATLSLKAGMNDIVLKSNTVSGMPNIDSLKISGVGIEAGSCTYTPPVVVEPEADAKVFVVGDSTVANYGESKYPQMGWGQVLQFFFDESKIDVENRARGGRSTRSYKVDGIWDEVLAEVSEDDYVFIQFGHNDRDWTKEERYANEADYETFLKEYVAETRAKNAIPVLVSPMVMNAWRDGALRNVFREDGNDYAGTMEKVAEELDVAYVDLNTESWNLVNKVGLEQASHYIFLKLDAGEYDNYPDGIDDFTHFQEAGAMEMARIVVEGLEALNADEDIQPLLDAVNVRYTMTVEQEGANGSIITSSSEYPAGTPLTFKTRAGDTDTFDAWYSAGTIVSENNLYQTTMPASKFTLTAAFNGSVPVANFDAATAFLIGDSTMSDYADGYYPQTGWGQVFQSYLDDSKITVDNRALGGRSSKSFYENHWDDVKASINEGDFVFIQFGINDRASQDPSRYAPTGGDFEGFMTSFVDETRELGATPILVTTVRRNQWRDGEPYDAYHEHPVVTRQLAADLSVPLIDLNAKNKALLEAVGEAYANEFYYMGFGANQYGNATAAADTVHFQKQGAVEIARLVSEGISELSSVDAIAPLVDALKPTYSVSVSSPTHEAGTITTAFEYPAGTPLTLKAVANQDDEFTQWLDSNRAEVSTDMIYEFDTTDAEATYEAVFNNSEGLGVLMTNLVTEIDGTEVKLTWRLENLPDDLVSIDVYRNDVAEINADRDKIAGGVDASDTFIDDTAEVGKTYWYMFKLHTSGDAINTQPEGEIRKPFVEEIPVTNLTTKIAYGSLIEVSWDLKYFDPEITYLELLRNDQPQAVGRVRVSAGTPLSGTLVDDDVEPGKTYWYMFKMVQDGVTGGTEVEGEITIPADAVFFPPVDGVIPGPMVNPEAPIITNMTTSLDENNNVVISWDLQNITEGTVIELMRNNKNEAAGRVGVHSTTELTGSFVDDTVPGGESYWYMFKFTKDLKIKGTAPEGEIAVP